MYLNTLTRIYTYVAVAMCSKVWRHFFIANPCTYIMMLHSEDCQFHYLKISGVGT